ncbi:MAG: DUF1232 domain-containing protein [Spirochaetales bacterium]|nr:DUF1232 domain-containing protein [Spirochaetales bacterium]
MLFKLIDETCSRINKMDPMAEAPKFAAQLLKMKPNFKRELQAQGIEAENIEGAFSTLCLAQLGVTKGIPAIAEEMTQMLRKGGGEPAFRCVIAAGLAYFVQPRDLLPDNLPGFYGFLDDALMLHEACALSWEVTGNTAQAEEKRKIFQFIFMFVPDQSIELFRSAVSGLAVTLNMMRCLDPSMAEMTTQMIIAQPLQQTAPQYGQGTTGGMSSLGSLFSNYQNNYSTQYSWRDGDKMGIMFPGGGGVACDSSGVYVL